MKSGFIDDEDQKGISKAIRDRVALVKRLRELKRGDGKEREPEQSSTVIQDSTAEKEQAPDKEQVAERESKKEEETLAAKLEVARQNSNEGLRTLDAQVVQRIESQSCTPVMGNSPHSTIDERVMADTEKVSNTYNIDHRDVVLGSTQYHSTHNWSLNCISCNTKHSQ